MPNNCFFLKIEFFFYFSKVLELKKNTLKYTTISGVEGFDGSKKEAKRINISKIN